MQNRKSFSIQLVVLDAMGVIYQARDDVGELLIPFARQHGCNVPDAEIYELYKQCSLGRFLSSTLWLQLGIQELDKDMDSQYLQNQKLSVGLINFLEEMKIQNIPVACLSNDVLEWSVKLRQIHHLEKYITYWTISGAEGVRKPDLEIYKALLKNTGYNSSDCLFIDDQIKNLNTAYKLGFKTLLFTTDALLHMPSSEHNVVSSFTEVASWIQASRS